MPSVSVRQPVVTTTIEVQGARAVQRHWEGIARLTEELTPQIVGVAGEFMANLAKEIHKPHILTGNTYFSISAGSRRGEAAAEVFKEGGTYFVDVGTIETNDFETSPSPQARLIEFGFTHVGSGQFIIFPFMMPAANITKPIFEDAMTQLVLLADSLVWPSGEINTDPRIMAKMTAARSFLYDTSKFLGDLQIFGVGGPAISAVRTATLGMARGIGDVQSVMRGAIGQRITARVAGRFSGAGISVTRSAVLSGPSSTFSAGSQRIYNRFAGRSLGLGLRGVGL